MSGSTGSGTPANVPTWCALATFVAFLVVVALIRSGAVGTEPPPPGGSSTARPRVRCGYRDDVPIFEESR
jgi:hypothetical protein